MDPAVVASVRRLYEAASFDDGVPALLALSHPDVEFIPRRVWFDLGEGRYTGHDEVARYFARMQEAFGRMRFLLERLTEHSDDTLIAEVVLETEGRASGVPTGQRVVHLLRFRDGLLVRVESFEDVDAARAAATG